MSFSLSVPTVKGTLSLEIHVGDMIFLLGANGTGKSSLMQAIASASSESTRRIAAHRQTWFRSGSPEFTGKQRAEYEQNMIHYDRQQNARWMDDYSQQRAQMAIYDLVNYENVRAREIARALDLYDTDKAKTLAAKDGAVTALNRLLRLANLDISVSVETNDEIMATRNGSQPYSIAKLSDGERNAILIAANVLTVPAGTLLLIDEPERHLHRSIVSPLLSLLLKEKPECAFIVSTHEPLLPIDNPGSKVLLMRSCDYDGDIVDTYDIDLLEDCRIIDDDLKRNILGERRKIVFVEGVEHSLDKPLYSLLFPNASVVAKGSCRDVEDAVTGITNSSELHWVKPFGLVDNDSSDPDRIAFLRTKGVIPLNVYSVESIYYHPEVQKLVGEKLTSLVGGDLEEKLARAKAGAIKAVSDNAKHLSAKIAEKLARAQVFSLLPKKGELATGAKRTAEIDFEKFMQDEEARIQALVGASDFIAVLQRYPIRESAALDAITKALGFANRTQYEAAVQNVLVHDESAVNFVRGLLGSFPAELFA